MAMASASEISDKWEQSMRTAEQAYRRGIERTDVNPMEEAAKNVDGYRQGVLDAVDSGRYQAGLRRVTKQEWQDKALKLGASRLASGATLAKPKMQAFLDKFLPHLKSVTDRVRQMPKVTLQDRIARAVAQMEGTATFKR